MLSESDVRVMCNGGESGTVEFKLKAPRPAEVAERICGMANTRTGGTIIFGVKDETGEIVGLSALNLSIDIVLRAARMIKPPVVLADSGGETHTIDGKTLLVVPVPANNGTLYQASGIFWLRRGSFTTPMNMDEISGHLQTTGTLHYNGCLPTRDD